MWKRRLFIVKVKIIFSRLQGDGKEFSYHKKWLEKPGSCSWQKIQEASEGMAPILEFPAEMFEKTIDITNDKNMKGEGLISPFEYYCRQNGLRYCIMPDLNPYDDYIPVAVLAQDFGMHDEQIKSFMRKRVEKEEAVKVDYDTIKVLCLIVKVFRADR